MVDQCRPLLFLLAPLGVSTRAFWWTFQVIEGGKGRSPTILEMSVMLYSHLIES